METSHDAEEIVVGVGPATVRHAQGIVLSEARLGAEYAFSSRLGLALVLPFRVTGTTVDYIDASGEVVEIERGDIHHRDETLKGIVDPWLLARASFARGRLRLDGRLGVSVPLGRTEEDPFALGDAGVRHQHLQFGTGTWNPVATLEATWQADGWSIGGFALTQQVLYENDKGYLAGDRYAAALGVQSALGSRRWMFRVGPELQAETRERWNGRYYDHEGNQGRLDVLVGAAARWRFGHAYEATAQVGVPVYTYAAGGQLAYPLVATVGVAAAFGGAGPAGEARHAHDEEGHGHEGHGRGGEGHAHEGHAHGEQARGEQAHGGQAHGERGEQAHGDHIGESPAPDWRGVDVKSIADDGQAVDLAPVPGVYTVFDFWAPWCKPCLDLDRRMADLARRHPGRIAVRKINIVDWDSPAASRYLSPRGFNLPHIKVFGPDRKPLYERSADPATLVEELERTIRRSLSPVSPVPPVPPAASAASPSR